MAVSILNTSRNNDKGARKNGGAKWSYRKTIAFALSVSLVFWSAIIIMLWFLS